MKGPPPKNPALRQRQNRTSTRATLPSEASTKGATVPKLPKRSPGTGVWHVRVKAWWESVWKSPMAGEYLEADRRGLERMAELEQRYWLAAERGENITPIAAEIRQQQITFGLTPMDRRRLQWEVERGESAAEKTSRRRPKADTKVDPRSVLKAV